MFYSLKQQCSFSILLLPLLLGAIPTRADTEVTEPIVIAGTEATLAGEPTFPETRQTFYNPTGLVINDTFHLFAHVATGPEFTDDGSYCWGDQVIHLTSPFTYEGLRKRAQFQSKITPCPPCESANCPEEDRFMWGLGGAFTSQIDGTHFLGVDYAKGDSVQNGEFLEVRLFRSTDGYAWEPFKKPGSQDPFTVLKQSELSCVSETNCSGPCIGGQPNAGEQCLLFQFLDLTLMSENDYWWGYFHYIVQTTNRIGKIRISPNDPTPGAYKVEVVDSSGGWRAANSDGTLDFRPNNYWRDGSVNVLFDGPNGLEAWAYEYAPDAVDGCDDGSSAVTSTSRITRRRHLPAGGSGNWIDATLGDPQVLRSRSRPAESINQTGRTAPFLLEDPDGNVLLYSASSDRVCSENPGAWPPSMNTFVGMDIVQTEIAEAWIRDGFSSTSERSEGDPLGGMTTELGNAVWTALGPAGLTIRDGYATDDGASDTRAANIPFLINDYPENGEIRIRGRVGTAGSQWVGLGLNGSTGSALLGTGQVWVLIRPSGSWELVSGDMTMASGTAAIDPDSVHLELFYDRVNRAAGLTVDGIQVLAPTALPDVNGQPFVPNFSAIGFQFFDPLPDQPGTNTLDRFEVLLFSSEIFDDEFESGNFSAWNARVP